MEGFLQKDKEKPVRCIVCKVNVPQDRLDSHNLRFHTNQATTHRSNETSIQERSQVKQRNAIQVQFFTGEQHVY